MFSFMTTLVWSHIIFNVVSPLWNYLDTTWNPICAWSDDGGEESILINIDKESSLGGTLSPAAKAL